MYASCEQHAKKYNKRLKICFSDYERVASNSQPRRSVSTLCNAYRSELPPEKSHSDPSAIAARVWAIWRCTPLGDTSATLAGVCRRMNKDGKLVVRYQTFVAKWPKVKENLDAVPRIRFGDPDSEDMAEVLRNLEDAKRDAIVRIGTYALKHPALAKTLKQLKINRPDVTIRVLFDWSSCRSCADALEASIELFEAGIDLRHRRTMTVHMNAVCVGSSYCFSGSTSFGDAGFSVGQIELSSHVYGPECITACEMYDSNFFGYTVAETGGAHQVVEPTTLGGILSMKEELERKKAGSGYPESFL
uniref:Phospholipase D-like domain-containing protein n=1 Tax=Phytophthora ramorum TaxID=164328 RepID=H3GXT2_PHYRM